MKKTIFLALLFCASNASAFGWARAVRFSGVGTGGVTPPAVHFDPFSVVGSTVISWYRSDSGLTLSGSQVTAWHDYGTAANNMVTNVGTVSVSSLTSNGLPMVYCPGNANILGSNGSGYSGTFTVFLAFYPQSGTAATFQPIFNEYNNTDDGWRFGKTEGPVQASMFTGAQYGYSTDNPILNHANLSVFKINYSGAAYISVNGGSFTGNLATGTNAWHNYPAVCEYPGAAYYTGNIMEILVVFGAMSDTDISTFKTGLNNWWAIY